MNENRESLELGQILKICLRSALHITFAIGVRYVRFLESLRHSRTLVTIRLIQIFTFCCF